MLVIFPDQILFNISRFFGVKYEKYYFMCEKREIHANQITFVALLKKQCFEYYSQHESQTIYSIRGCETRSPSSRSSVGISQ
jgi:hypothetical protein